MPFARKRGAQGAAAAPSPQAAQSAPDSFSISRAHTSQDSDDRLTTNFNVLSFDCGVTNLAYCFLEYAPEDSFEVRCWERVSLRASETKHVVDALVRELDKRPWMLQVDHVVIEQQDPVSALMKVVSHTLQAYFLCRCTSPLVRTDPYQFSRMLPAERYRTVPKIAFVSPKLKFKATTLDSKIVMKDRYRKNKVVAVQMAQKLLLEKNPDAAHNEPLQYLMSVQKNDDLADSFLQGIYYLRVCHKRDQEHKRIRQLLAQSIDCEDLAADATPVRDATVDAGEREYAFPIIYRSRIFAERADLVLAPAQDPPLRYVRNDLTDLELGD